MTPRHRSRLSLLLCTGVAAAGTLALTAGPGSAQTPPASLHLVGTAQRGVGFAPARPRQGSTLGFGERVSGDDTGISRSLCTFMAKQNGLLCTVWLRLSKGTITAQGFVPERAHAAPVAITGGTGAYDGARGTARATDVSATKTSIDITFR